MTVAQAKKLAARFYQLKTGHCLTGHYLQWTTRRPDAECWWCNYKPHTESICSRTARSWKASRAAVREETGRGKDRFKISELFAGERCSKANLDFLATTEVGPAAGPPVADEEPGSEASEWEKGEREEYLAQVAEEERALRKIRRRGVYRLSFLSLFPFISYVKHRKAEETS